MASMFRSGSSRRKPEAPGKIRIQLKGKNSKVLNSEDEDEVVMEDNSSAMNLDNGIPDDLPEGTIVVQPQAVEDAPVKKKREPPVRIDTSVLDSVSCTACGRQLNPYKGGALQKHPELKVVICKRCEKFLSSGDIAKDKDGTDEQCRWCGEGGRLVVCDECASAFCKTCVMRNFNRSEFNNINGQQNWRCYLCNKAPLQGLRENYRKIRDTLKALHLRDKAKAAAAAAPASNGTQSSEKSAGTKQISGGSAPTRKGRGVQDTVCTSTQRNNSSASSKSNWESSQSLSEKGKNVKGTETGDFTLRLEDINVSYDHVDTVMDKLSTATNTFKEMLRALRSQFHATSPRGSDEAPPMFQFSLSSMNVQEKKRRCAKALNMGLETYIKSIKTILTGNTLIGETIPKKDTEGKRENAKDKEPVLLSTASKQSKSTTKTKEVNINGVDDSSSGTSRTKRQATSKQNLKRQEKSRDDHSSSEESSEDTPKNKSSKKKMEKNKELEKVNNDSKSAENLSMDTDDNECENKNHSSDSESAKCSSKVDSGSEKVTAKSQGRKTDKESASHAASRKNKITSGAKSTAEGENLTDLNSDNADLNSDNAEDKSSHSVSSVISDSENAVHSTVNKNARTKDTDKDIHKNSLDDEENSAIETGETPDIDSNKKDIQNNELEDEQTENDKTSSKDKPGSKSLKRKKSQQTEEDEANLENSSGETQTSKGLAKNKTDKASSENNAGEDDENLAAKFDLIKELADEILKDNEEDDNDGEEDDLSVHASKTTDNTKSASDPKSSMKGKSKRKKDDLSSDSDGSDSMETKRPKNLSSSSKSKSLSTEQKKAKNTVDGAMSSDVSSSDLLMSDDSDGITPVRRQRKKRKEMPKPAETSTKSAKQKTEPIKKEKPQANGKPKSKSSLSDVKVNGKEADVDELDKEIDKLAKMPTMRKRKAVNPESDTNPAEDEVEGKSKGTNQATKKSKPGPKCSKKARDYDGLSSEDDVNKESEHDDDDDNEDEDLPPVKFFMEEPQSQDVENMEDDENEMAKNGLLEDLDDEEDDDEDDDDISSEEDSDSPKKSKSKKKEAKKSPKVEVKKEEQEEEENQADSDENIGKRKQIKSKLLDTKLSDSDSDISKPKKKKKDSDEGSYKSKDSSGSSIESDLTDDEEEGENEDGEEVDDDDDEPKSKKKGKKKGRKRRKRKGKKGSDDDENEEEGSDGGKKKKKGKRRRRIKKMSNSSDEDGEGDGDSDDDPNSSKAGKRKQIRKVMSNKKLEDSTKAAAKAEEKRRKRIAAKQREFNIETITDENNPMNCPITTKLILEPGKEEGDEPAVQVNKSLIRKLKPHQVEAVQFMWDCMYESVKRSKKEQGAGCILAHCMGLGKTLSVISFVHTILTHEKILKHRTCLVVSPLNTVLNWRNEWTMWLNEEDQLDVWELASCKQNPARADALKDWQESGGIMIMGYEMYRNLTTGNRCKNKRQKKIFQETLVDPGPDLVICDEGHILKNEASAISKAMNMMKTRRRVVLTGTPLQNNLNEYHCMLSFVKPNLLGTRKEFNNRFISPIQNGQCTDSTQRDVKLMKARAHVLHEMLAGCVQRRDYSALTKFLPPKQEYVISVRLTNIQIELYEKYLELTGQGVDGIFTNKGARLFTDYQNLMKIWTHPWVLKLAEIRDEMKMKYDDEDSFIDDDDSEAERSFSSSSSSSDEEKAMNDSGGEGTSAGPSAKRGTRRTRAKARRQAGEDSDPEEVIAEWKSKTRNGKGDEDATMEEPDRSVTKEWWAPYVTEDDKLKLELSNKLVLLFEILRMCEEIGDKVLIFSQSILSLNIIESFLEVIDSKFQQECENATEEEKEDEEKGFGKSWTKNLDYYRMDGSTSAQNRQMWAASFNDLDNYRARLFLISTRAGGLGINLVAANRVIIFDASWNPSHDVQSIFRVYRFGQTKPCYIYRFLAQGTMEEKIYERQVTKLSLSQRVVDEHQIERHFSANDLKELYNFRADKWDDGTEKPTLALPKDPLLAEILTSNKHCVVSFHEHDSLLENQVEQTLTEEEKKAAWEEYENEKKGIIMRGPGMERTASWPMMAAAQILSREQITATVQALRQQLPDISEDLFHMHVQQALRRQVQMKQEEMRRMELLRLQEMNYLNMIKQQAEQSGLSHAQSLQAMQNMAPWMQMQRLRAMQNNMLMNMHPSSSMSLLGQALSNPMSTEGISNKPEEAIDLDDN